MRISESLNVSFRRDLAIDLREYVRAENQRERDLAPTKAEGFEVVKSDPSIWRRKL